MMNNGPSIEVKYDNGLTIVSILREEVLEEHVIADIAESLFSIVAEQAPIKIVLNFGKVQHMSSSALGMLIRLNKRVDESKGVLKLSEIKPALYEVFLITKLHKLFDIYRTTEMAIQSFQH